MAELRIAPSDIYYSQSSISNCFSEASEHTENSIGDTVDGIFLKRYRIDDIPKISVVRKGDVWVTADNRRLWVFKALESLGQCARISVIIKRRISYKKSVVQKDIKVRGDPGGIFYKLKVRLCDVKTIKKPMLFYSLTSLVYIFVGFFFRRKMK